MRGKRTGRREDLVQSRRFRIKQTQGEEAVEYENNERDRDAGVKGVGQSWMHWRCEDHRNAGAEAKRSADELLRL